MRCAWLGRLDCFAIQWSIQLFRQRLGDAVIGVSSLVSKIHVHILLHFSLFLHKRLVAKPNFEMPFLRCAFHPKHDNKQINATIILAVLEIDRDHDAHDVS